MLIIKIEPQNASKIKENNNMTTFKRKKEKNWVSMEDIESQRASQLVLKVKKKIKKNEPEAFYQFLWLNYLVAAYVYSIMEMDDLSHNTKISTSI